MQLAKRRLGFINQAMEFLSKPFAKTLKYPEFNWRTIFLDKIMRRTTRRLNQFAVFQSDLRPGERVLDVGSGQGYGMKLALERVAPMTVAHMRYNIPAWFLGPQWKAVCGFENYKVHLPFDKEGFVQGVDISQYMITRSELLLQRLKKADRFVVHQGSVHRLPLRTSSIDACFHVDCFYFWPSLTTGVEEIRRVLRPDGRLVTTFSPARLDAWNRWGGLRYARADPLAYIMALEEAGFQDLEWIKEDHRFSGLHCIKARKPKLGLLTEGESSLSEGKQTN